jgi:hypothetical protein
MRAITRAYIEPLLQFAMLDQAMQAAGGIRSKDAVPNQGEENTTIKNRTHLE